MNKKLTAIFSAVVCLALCKAAGASEIEIKNDINTMNITISGNLGEEYSDCRVMVYAVLSDDESVLDVSDTISAAEKYKIFRQVKTDGLGKFSVSNLKLSGAAGNYKFYAVSHNPNKVFSSESLYLPTQTELKAFLNGISGSNKDKIFETLNDEVQNKRLNILLPFYSELSSTAKLSVCGAMENKNYDSVDKVIEDVVRYSVKCGVTDTKNPKNILMMIFPDKYDEVSGYSESIKAENGFNDLTVFPEYIELNKMNITDAEKIIASAVKSEYSSSRELMASISQAIVFGEIKSVPGYGDIEEVLKKYKDSSLSKLDFSRYASGTYKNDINKSLLKKSFNSLDELCEYINKYKPESAGGGGSSGGGGGSSKPSKTVSSSKAVNAVNTPITDKAPEINIHAVFHDLSDYSWAEKSIKFLKEKGYINGVDKNVFNPSGEITREAFIKILVLSLDKYNKDAKTDFSDVESGAWYESYVASAVDAGIVKGVSDDIFGVGKSLTRQDAAVILSRAVQDDELAVSGGFADNDNISDYAKSAVLKMNSLKIISGYEDNTFRPNNILTRAEACVIIERIINR